MKTMNSFSFDKSYNWVIIGNQVNSYFSGVNTKFNGTYTELRSLCYNIIRCLANGICANYGSSGTLNLTYTYTFFCHLDNNIYNCQFCYKYNCVFDGTNWTVTITDIPMNFV